MIADSWSAACTFVEMFLQRPLFAGKNAHDQLARIMRVLGSPSPDMLMEMSEELDLPELLEQECGALPRRAFRDVSSVLRFE